MSAPGTDGAPRRGGRPPQRADHNGSVQIPLTVIGGTQLAAAFLWATLVVFGNGYLEPTPAFTYGCGLLLMATVALVGIALSHGRWAWRLTLGVIGMEAIAAVLVEPTAWWWVGLLISAAGLILTLGPWIDPHVRQLPPAAPLPKESMALMLGLLGLPSVLALTNEIDVWAGVLAAVGVITAWAYGRAFVVGLWAARTLLLPLALAVAFTGGWVRARRRRERSLGPDLVLLERRCAQCGDPIRPAAGSDQSGVRGARAT